ncbi:hypothetical protein [Helicobacter felistomachi]|uniref:hypothetical protein n=1 Tax=Helicobacter felistomachi TaxID=3040201 RepID=UPI002573BD68|nr:hypothetical protein [Helicobacter sp. NHP21005]
MDNLPMNLAQAKIAQENNTPKSLEALKAQNAGIDKEVDSLGTCMTKYLNQPIMRF